MPAPPIHHLVGLRPVTIGPAAVSFTMPASPRLRSDAGVFHAGTAALVADTALAGAIQVALPPGAMVATSDLTLNFLRPVDVDSGQLIARARPIDVGDTLGLAEGIVEDGRGADRPCDHPLLRAPDERPGDDGGPAPADPAKLRHP